MADKKIYDDELLSDDELDKVTGGTSAELGGDFYQLLARGLVKIYADFDTVMGKLNSNGYKVVYNHPEENEYYNRQGQRITRQEFWHNFDAENGTTVDKRTAGVDESIVYD